MNRFTLLLLAVLSATNCWAGGTANVAEGGSEIVLGYFLLVAFFGLIYLTSRLFTYLKNVGTRMGGVKNDQN